MCGRYALRSSTPALARMLGIDLETSANAPEFAPSFNIAPTQGAPVCRVGGEGHRVLRIMRWGLIPSWTKGDSAKFSMINARAETLTQKPAYRTPFRFRRCLVPADGFYEWQRVDGRKQPFLIRRRDELPFMFAGLWERWRKSEDEVIDSYSIITTDANQTLRPIHERMPVILDPADFDRWLDREENDTAKLQPLLRPCRDDDMLAHPVSTFVNKPANNDERCWQPLTAPPGPVG